MNEANDWPGVSYVMPALNEEPYLEAAVLAVLGQDYPGDQEIVLAVAPSTDGTEELAQRLVTEHPQVRLVRNPGRDIPKGLNLAIRSSSNPIIVRVDAHSELPLDYTRLGVATLQRTGAANVGGLMRARGRSEFQHAVAAAYNSPIALGGGRYHSGTTEGPCESAYLGIFRREVLVEVGMFNENVRRGEDWELNYRIRQAGYLVWFNPELKVTYWPRQSARQLARQFYSTGAWRGSLVRTVGRRTPLRFFAPPALVASAVLSVGHALAAPFLRGPARWTGLVWLGPAAYLAFLVWAGRSKSARGTERQLFLQAIAVMHTAWGVGFWSGLIRGTENTVDTSRLND